MFGFALLGTPFSSGRDRSSGHGSDQSRGNDGGGCIGTALRIARSHIWEALRQVDMRARQICERVHLNTLPIHF